MTKSSFLLKTLSLGLALSGCSTAYILKPLTTSEVMNENCVMQASLFEATKEETFLKISVQNKSETAFEISPTSFSIQSVADTLSVTPVSGAESIPYLKKLSSQAELYEARANTTNWLGMDALTGSDEYRKLRSEQKTVEAEQKENLKRAEKLRARVAKINGRTLEKISLASGKTVEGIVIFPAFIKNDGPLTLDSQNPLCTVSLGFEAD